MDLFHKLGFDDPEQRKYFEGKMAKTSSLAVVLAHVRESDNQRLAGVIGVPNGGKPEDAMLKPLRFKRLMAATDIEDMMTGFRRVVQMLDGKKANIRDIAQLFLSHGIEGLHDPLRVRFAFDYYNSGTFAPDATSSSTDTETNKD